MHGPQSPRTQPAGELECPFSVARQEQPLRRRTVTRRTPSMSTSTGSLDNIDERHEPSPRHSRRFQQVTLEPQRSLSDPTPPSAAWQQQHGQTSPWLSEGSSVASLPSTNQPSECSPSLSRTAAVHSPPWLKWYAGATTIACICLLAVEVARYSR